MFGSSFGLGGYHSHISHPAAKLAQLLPPLQHGDDTEKLLALTELCEIFSLCTEDQLGSIRIGDWIRALTNILCDELVSPDITLLVCRTFCNLLEAFPQTAGLLVQQDSAIEALCLKLLNIQFIDVAEQALMVVRKLSNAHPTPLLMAGGFDAVLTNIDFFPGLIAYGLIYYLRGLVGCIVWNLSCSSLSWPSLDFYPVGQIP